MYFFSFITKWVYISYISTGVQKFGVETLYPLPRFYRIDGRTRTRAEASPDIQAWWVWRQGQIAFFDIRLTNLNANSQKQQTIETISKKCEKEKKRTYNNRIMNVEHGAFTPLVFLLTEGEGPEMSMFHKHIAQKHFCWNRRELRQSTFSN